MTDFVDEQQIAQQAIKDWKNKPEIRDEFPDVATYQAFLKAEAQGLVKIRSGEAQKNV